MGWAGYQIISTRSSKTETATKTKHKTLANSNEYLEKRTKPKNPARTARIRATSASLVNIHHSFEIPAGRILALIARDKLSSGGTCNESVLLAPILEITRAIRPPGGSFFCRLSLVL